MEEIIEYRQNLFTGLEGGADELSSLVERMPPDTWHSPTVSSGRTPHYILASLQALEAQLYSLTLHRITEENTPLLPLFDLPTWMGEHYQPGKAVNELVAEFCSLRRQDVSWLRTLPAEAWNRLARHPWWGKRSLMWWAELQRGDSRQRLRELSACLPG